jgi:hypothetical protein
MNQSYNVIHVSSRVLFLVVSYLFFLLFLSPLCEI